VQESVQALVRRFWFDLVIVALAIWGAVDGYLNPLSFEGIDKGPAWLVIGIGPVIALPLLARRRLPFFAPLVPFAVAIAASFISAEAVVDTTPNFFTLLVAIFIASSRPVREAAAALALAIVAVIAVDANMNTFEWGDFVFPAMFFAILSVLGAVYWTREERARDALDRARRLEQEARQAVAEERNRITRELHDVLAHSVSVMTVQASAVRRLLTPEQQREREALMTVEETGRQALSEMRRLLGIMRTEEEVPALAPQPGLGTLPALVEQVRQSGLPVELTVEGQPVKLPAGVDLSAYRIVQEALTNALKHAGPAHAWVAVRYVGDDVEIEVANDGRSQSENDGAGHGLVGMRERVALCGGELHSGPRPGGGFKISARLPVAGSTA
jgi:signal transduction histidine kinase